MFPTVTLNPNLSEIDQKIVPLVKTINKLMIPTYYSCEGHEGMNAVQSRYPMVVICPETSHEGPLTFLRFVGMLGIYNTNHDGEEYYLTWSLTPFADKTITLAPLLKYESLAKMQAGIPLLAKSLEIINTRYKL